MSTIAYIGNFGFPDKNASGKRVMGNCKALSEYGLRVICIGPGTGEKYQYDGITVYSINRGNEIQRVLKDCLKRINEILKQENVDCVILYGAIFTERKNNKLIQWCHHEGISVVYDQVDWLDLNWHNPFRGIIRAHNHYVMNRKVIPACDGLICISSYLARYHEQNQMRTIIVPPLSVTQAKFCTFDTNVEERPIIMAYAGTTSDIHRPTSQWKDRIDIILEVLNEVAKNNTLKPFVLNIYGMTEKRYLDMFPIRERKAGEKTINELGTQVVFHGSLPNKEIIKKIGEADFTILVRDKKRATMAGFPTKVSESISCGTPVLSNDTSDIREYIINGQSGFVMDDISQLFIKALSLSTTDLGNMKLECCNNPFYFKRYDKLLGEFVETIIDEKRSHNHEWL